MKFETMSGKLIFDFFGGQQTKKLCHSIFKIKIRNEADEYFNRLDLFQMPSTTLHVYLSIIIMKTCGWHLVFLLHVDILFKI